MAEGHGRGMPWHPVGRVVRAIAGAVGVVAVVAALVVLLAAGCAAKRPACAIVAPAAPGPPLLWRVQRDAGPIVWLYGTIHDASIDAVPGAALAALAASTRFVSELGDVEPDRERLRELTRIPSGPGIDHQLGDDWWDLRDLLRDVIREDDLRRARPWYALILLDRRSAPRVVAMDASLGARARAFALPVEALERVEDQIAALDAVVSIDNLRAALRERATMPCQHAALHAAYKAGDLASLAGMLVLPRTAETVLYARNRRWLPVIERYLAEGGAFVAVGAGHLLGEQGLPALLARAGYTVERAAEHRVTR